MLYAHFNRDFQLLAHQVALGVPCLYQVENLIRMRVFTPSRLRKFTGQDYCLIREALETYGRNRLAKTDHHSSILDNYASIPVVEGTSPNKSFVS